MVRFKINPSKTVARRLVYLGVFIFVFIFTTVLVMPKLNEEKDGEIDVTPPEEALQEETEETPEYNQISFQSVIDDWANTVQGKKSVVIYDLDREEIVGGFNADENYNTASLYKLFVVYEGYLKIMSGEWDTEAPAGSTGYTILKCLDLSIRESHSPCAETLWGMIGHSELDSIVSEKFNTDGTSVSNLSSNANDIAKMMTLFYHHEEITDDSLIGVMRDSFLNQPVTTYNWRQGLPSGFKKADVYNKVGWDFNGETRIWNIYHDASIVDFPETDRHFVVVVMTSGVNYEKIADLGSRIEEYFYENQ